MSMNARLKDFLSAPVKAVFGSGEGGGGGGGIRPVKRLAIALVAAGMIAGGSPSSANADEFFMGLSSSDMQALAYLNTPMQDMPAGLQGRERGCFNQHVAATGMNPSPNDMTNCVQQDRARDAQLAVGLTLIAGGSAAMMLGGRRRNNKGGPAAS